MLGKIPLQKERVYLNAELMDLLDFTASIFGVSSSEILRFSLKKGGNNGSFKKPKRAQGVFFKQKCAKAGKKGSKKEATSDYCLPYFANMGRLANRSEAKSICVVETTATASASASQESKKRKG